MFFKKLRLVMFLLCIVLLINPNITYAAGSPTDIKNHWASKDITSAASEGWAYLEGQKFNPNKPATREEVIWMLVGALKIAPYEGFDINKKADLTKFKDTPSSFSKDRMAIAVGNGIIGGYPDKTLKPKSSITRAEFAVIIGRLIKEDAPAGFSPFWDYIPAWALTEIKKVHAKEIVKGYPDGTFGANKSVTKAEALTMIKRWKDKQNNKTIQSYISPDAPAEFKKVYEIFKEKSYCGSTRLYYSNQGVPSFTNCDVYLTISSSGRQAIVLKNYEPDTLSAAKEMLKTYYPIQYETAYQDLLQVKETGKEISGKNYDGRTFECFVAQYLQVSIGVKK